MGFFEKFGYVPVALLTFLGIILLAGKSVDSWGTPDWVAGGGAFLLAIIAIIIIRKIYR